MTSIENINSYIDLSMVQLQNLPHQETTKILLIPTIESYLSFLENWQANIDYKFISKEFRFKNHAKQYAFIALVNYLAQSMEHYPKITSCHENCEIKLTTIQSNNGKHGINLQDLILAARLEVNYNLF